MIIVRVRALRKVGDLALAGASIAAFGMRMYSQRGSGSRVGTTDGRFVHVDVLDVLKVGLRQWYVVLPVVLLSLAAGIGPGAAAAAFLALRI
jgi:hypothetical protein